MKYVKKSKVHSLVSTDAQNDDDREHAALILIIKLYPSRCNEKLYSA